MITDPDELTPIERLDGYWLKRDDLFAVGGVCGGKTRTVYKAALRTAASSPTGKLEGIISGGGKGSRRVNVVAQVARHLGVPCRIHTPTGIPTPEIAAAVAAGAERVTHYPGFGPHLMYKAKKDADTRPGWCYCAFGGECLEAVEEADHQSQNLPLTGPDRPRRIVITAGSAMVLCGLLRYIVKHAPDVPVLGVAVGHDPTEQLNRWVGIDWPRVCKIVKPAIDFFKPAPPEHLVFRGIPLDAYYEAKCVPFLEPGDLFWIIGLTSCQTELGRAAPLVNKPPRAARVPRVRGPRPGSLPLDDD